MAEAITIDELLAAMEAATKSSSVPGMSTHEISMRMNWGIDKTRRYVKAAIASGELKAARKPTVGMDGRQNWTSVYYPSRKPAESPVKVIAAGRAAKASRKK